jgi:hypothetical protein
MLVAINLRSAAYDTVHSETIAKIRLRKLWLIRHCEELSDEAISKRLIMNSEIAALRSQ